MMDEAIFEARLSAAEAQLERYRILYLEMEKRLRQLEQLNRELRGGT